jgi:hypothetical protein
MSTPVREKGYRFALQTREPNRRREASRAGGHATAEARTPEPITRNLDPLFRRAFCAAALVAANDAPSSANANNAWARCKGRWR